VTAIRIIPPHVEFITDKYFTSVNSGESYLQAAVRLIEECGRVSHKSEGRIKSGSAEPFVKKIAMKYGHESILEHVNYTICIVGSRSMTHQLVRHRLAAYTQESQRYCDYSKDGAEEGTLGVIMPPAIGDPEIYWGLRLTGHEAKTRTAPPITKSWIRDRLADYEEYRGLRRAGIPADDVRSVLPNACKTEIYTTFNLRVWRHVLGLRTERHASWEIRYLMTLIHRHFMQHIPFLFRDIKPEVEDIESLLL
jgi:thymidylate synthase (FAD)